MCIEFLSDTCDKLANKFKHSLLSTKEQETIVAEKHDPDPDILNNDQPNHSITSDCDPEYYGSDSWNDVDAYLDSFNVPQPGLPTGTTTNTCNCTS